MGKKSHFYLLRFLFSLGAFVYGSEPGSKVEGTWMTVEMDPIYVSIDRLRSHRFRVDYFSEYEREEKKLQIGKDGILLSKDGAPLDHVLDVPRFLRWLLGRTLKFPEDFVILPDGRMFSYSSHTFNYLRHSSAAAGGPVIFAGKLASRNGKVVYISNHSGHYRPGFYHLLEGLRFLYFNKVDLSEAEVYFVPYFEGPEIYIGKSLDLLKVHCSQFIADQGKEKVAEDSN